MLDIFFNPKSVAIIGASHKPEKIGYVILENFVKGGYKGRVYPVNPDTTPIFDLKVYPSVKRILDKIDLAVIVVPAKAVLKVLKECVEKKVKAVIIVSGGFSETGREGKKLEEKIKQMIKKTETRVMGPNCLGVFDPLTKVDTIFNPVGRLARPISGNVGFISQSGAVGATTLDRLAEERIGISKFISYENGVDINECDSIEFLGSDKRTKVIMLFLEGVRDGKRFIKAARDVSKKKPIIALKGGKTERGGKAVMSHTGSLTGSAKIYSAVFKQTGIIETNDLEEFFDLSRAFSTQPLPKGDRLVIITNGGGFGVLAVDEAERQKLNLAEPSEKLKNKLKKKFPRYVILDNPIDLTGDVTAERYAIAIRECLKEYDGVIAITLFQVPTLEEEVTDIIIKLSKKSKRPILCCAAGGRFTKKLSDLLKAAGVPVYPTPERAVRAFAAMVRYTKIR